jgi:DNA-binding IclR family transcriptional regulator
MTRVDDRPSPREHRSVTDRVLALLGAFDRDHPVLSLAELARRSGVSTPTAHRRLAELVAWGALERLPDGRYRVGLRLWELASLAPRGQRLREAALPFLEDLYVVTRENVQLAVREGTELVFVERIAGRFAVPVMTRVGSRFPLHAPGVGLVLLAHAPDDVREAVLAGPLPRYTEHTVTDPARLRSLLADVRRQGFAVSDRMVTHNALSVAAPVRDRAGEVLAAVSLVVLAEGAEVPALAAAVRTAARSVTRELGGSSYDEVAVRFESTEDRSFTE